MSDSDSDSTDSDNNNLSPYYHYHLGRPRMPVLEVDYESSIDNSDSDHQPLDHGHSSDSDVTLHNTSEDTNDTSDNTSDDSSCNSSILLPFLNLHNHKRNVSNNWSITKELYNREIGLYKNSAMWSNKFYQSVVAVQKLKLSKQLKGHEGCVNSLDFNLTGNLLASGSDDYKVCLWNWSEGKCILEHNSRHTRNIFQTKFLITQGDIHIVSCARDGLIILSSVNNGGSVFDNVLAQHDRSCNKLALHQDLPYEILSCGEDGFVKSIDIRESPNNENGNTKNLLEIKKHGIGMHLYGIDINPMKPLEFIINGNDEYIRMYDKRNLSEPVKKFRRISPTATASEGDNDTHSNFDYRHITSAVYNYSGTEILASYSEDDIYLFETYGPSDTYLHRYDGHLNRITIKSVNFYGPRSEYVVSGSDCGNIFIWDKKTEAIVQRKHADANGTVNVLEAHPHIPTLATSGIDKTIKIWEPLKKWQQPNKYKLRMCLIKNRAEKERTSRLYGISERRIQEYEQAQNSILINMV